MRVAKRSAIEKDFFPQPLQMPHESFTHARSSNRTGEYIFQTSSLQVFPKKTDTPHGRPRWSTTWSRTRIQVSFWEREKQSLGRGLESEPCKNLFRRRFKKIEDAPLAAYDRDPQILVHLVYAAKMRRNLEVLTWTKMRFALSRCRSG